MSADLVRRKIKSIRHKKGLRAMDVAKKIGMSRPFYTQLESGSRGISIAYLFEIAKALDVSIGELCGELEKNTSKMQEYWVE